MGLPQIVFYRNDNGVYTSLTTPFTLLGTHLANCWGDVDNDGHLDVLISTDQSATISLYRNKKDGTFANATTASSAGGSVSGIALADYDNDGDLDFYTNGAGEARGLFRNQLASSNHWAQFALEGSTSNRSAIGAEIRVKAVLDGTAVWQLRQVVAHNSFQSQSDLRQHFGLGNAAQIDSMLVRWPSGALQAFSGVAANNFYKIVEGQGITTGAQEVKAATIRSLQILPNPASDHFQIRFADGAAEKITAVEMFDSIGRLVACDLRWQNDRAEVRFAKGLPGGIYQVRAQLADGTTAIGQVAKQ